MGREVSLPDAGFRRWEGWKPKTTEDLHPPWGGEKADKCSSVLLLFYCAGLVKALSGPIFLLQKGRAIGEY